MHHRAYRRAALPWGLVAASLLAGCKQEAAVAPPLTRVRVVTAEVTGFAPRITRARATAAQVQSEVAFRIAGKISERLANVGDRVTADQVVARLDPEEQRADLLARGKTTRREHDPAETALLTAQAQPVFALARDGGRDAIFNVYEWALAQVELDKGLAVSLVGAPAVHAQGTVRLVSPAVDPDTVTVQVRLGLADPPPAMAIGSRVNGVGPLKPRSAVLLTGQAAFEHDRRPAVRVVDPAAATVARQRVTIVSAAAQMPGPGQKVEIAAERRS